MKSYRFAWIGGGQLTRTMLPALLSRGHHCEGWWMRNPLRGATLEVPLRAEALDQFSSRAAELIFFAVSDDELPQLASSIKLPEGMACLHCSGAQDLEVLASVGTRRPLGVCYPLQSFSTPLDAEQLSRVPFLIEAQSEPLRAQIISLVKSLGARPYICSTEERRHLHLAAVMVNNWTTHILSQAYTYLRKLKQPFDLLYPLIDQTLEQARLDPTEVQSGPSRRGDSKITQKHKEMLKDHPELLHIYQLFDQSIQLMHHSDPKPNPPY